MEIDEWIATERYETSESPEYETFPISPPAVADDVSIPDAPRKKVNLVRWVHADTKDNVENMDDPDHLALLALLESQARMVLKVRLALKASEVMLAEMATMVLLVPMEPMAYQVSPAEMVSLDAPVAEELLAQTVPLVKTVLVVHQDDQVRQAHKVSRVLSLRSHQSATVVNLVKLVHVVTVARQVVRVQWVQKVLLAALVSVVLLVRQDLKVNQDEVLQVLTVPRVNQDEHLLPLNSSVLYKRKLLHTSMT
jgi:hypothetical protein